MGEGDRCRSNLERLLNPTEELLCVAPAVHRTADGQRSQPVWLGVGKIRARHEHAVFIFSRAIFACFQSLQEWIYCVLPVAANIRVDVGPDRCAFSWSPASARLGRNALVPDWEHLCSHPSDCIIEDVQNGTEVLALLEESHRDACAHGFVFHEEQRANHRELWKYHRAMPMDLAGLPSLAVSIQGTRRTRCSLRDSIFNTNKIELLCITWNVGATLPQEGQSLQALFEQEAIADLVCIGLQETCELSARRLIADGDEWYAWREWAEKEVSEFYLDELELLAYSHLVGMLILIFTRSTLRDQISNIRTTAIGLGVGGYGGNKGAVSIRFDISSTSFCFVNAHLASGQEHYIERCQHFQTIMKRIEFQEDLDAEEEDLLVERALSTPIAGGLGRPTGAEMPHARPHALSFADRRAAARATYRIEDHDHIFWIGDTNSRLHWPGKLGGMPIQEAMQRVQERRIGELLALDQLSLSRRDGLAFQGFEEHRIRFLPSYKWRRDGDALDMRSQKHVPAWTDRILFRSSTRPGALVHRYDMYQGLRQSDHRLVFACFTVPWTGPEPGAGAEAPAFRQLEVCADMGLSLEPSEVAFRSLKPDQPQESSVRLVLHGPAMARFKVLLRWPDGQLRPVGGSGAGSALGAAHGAGGGPDGEEPAVPLVARWLAATPSQGTLRRGHPAEVLLSLCVGEAVLRRRDVEAVVVIRLQDSPLHAHDLPVRASLVPSVFRAPLGALAGMGSRPLLQSGEGREASTAPGVSERVSAGVCLPPKEVMAVMQWVLQQSRDSVQQSLEWWPDPLLDGVCRGKDELSEVQRHVEHGWPLPVGKPQMPPRSAALFLLRWLSLLPEPVLTELSMQLSDGTPRGVLHAMPPLPRSVLICIAALFTQLAKRHGAHGDVVSRLGCCLTQQAQPQPLVEQVLTVLMSDLAADSAFPPLAALAAAAGA